MYRDDAAGERVRAYLAWKDEVGYRAAIAMRCADLEPLTGRLRVEITIHGMARNYDVENASKALCDGMNKVVYGDDMQIDELLIRRVRSTSEPVSCVRVWELGGETP